ncbi:MAG: sterol desaturase family protein [Pseudobdellovibrionaceae bacterium]
MGPVVASKDSAVTRIHSDIWKHGWSGLVGSIVLMLIVHELNFYLSHRLLHRPKLFRAIHGLHHRAKNPSVFSAFAVHPVEMILVLGYLVPLSFIIPIHWAVLEGFVLALGLHSICTHSNVEFLPNKKTTQILLKVFTNSRHHNDHHKFIQFNFGYGTVLLDRWFQTEKKIEPVSGMSNPPSSLPSAEENTRARSVV